MLADLQHLHKGHREFLGEPSPEGREGVVVGMAVGGDEAQRQGVVGCPLHLAAGVASGGIALDQQRELPRGVVGQAAPPGAGPFQRAKIHPLDDLDHLARQVPCGEPILHRRWDPSRIEQRVMAKC